MEIKSKGNLLLLDDELALSESLKELLEEEASAIFIAKNGLEALDIIAREKIDCVVSDIRMPLMDGISFMRIARRRGFRRPIIFFTAHATDLLDQEIRELGACDVLMKPNFTKLELAVRKHLAAADSPQQ